LEIPPTESYNFISPQEALNHIDLWLQTIDETMTKANASQKAQLQIIKNRLLLVKNLNIRANTGQIAQISEELRNYLNYYKQVQFQKIQQIQQPVSKTSLVDIPKISDLQLKASLFKVDVAPNVVFAQESSPPESSPSTLSQGEIVSLDGGLRDRGENGSYYNILGDTQLAKEVYEKDNYLKEDINGDGILDVIWRDKNTVNIKF